MTYNKLKMTIPEYRLKAKEIAKLADWRAYVKNDIMLEGLVISYLPITLEDQLPEIAAFVPKINGWDVCDCFCTGIKPKPQEKLIFWNFLQPFLKTNREFEVRFAIVMMLLRYTDVGHLPLLFDIFDAVCLSDYYVEMATAWAICECCAHFPDETIDYLKRAKITPSVKRKAQQKIRESFRVSDENKKRASAI